MYKQLNLILFFIILAFCLNAEIGGATDDISQTTSTTYTPPATDSSSGIFGTGPVQGSTESNTYTAPDNPFVALLGIQPSTPTPTASTPQDFVANTAADLSTVSAGTASMFTITPVLTGVYGNVKVYAAYKDGDVWYVADATGNFKPYDGKEVTFFAQTNANGYLASSDIANDPFAKLRDTSVAGKVYLYGVTPADAGTSSGIDLDGLAKNFQGTIFQFTTPSTAGVFGADK